MINIKKNTLFILIGMFTLLLILGGKVYGADATLPSSKNMTTNDTITINVGVQATEAWNLKLSSTGGTLGGTTTSADASEGETTKTVMTATFSTTIPGTYTIKLTGEVTGSDLVKKPVNKTMTINVTVPQTQPQTQPKPQNPTPPAEPKFQNVNQTVYAKSEVNVRSSYSTSSSSLGKLQAGDSVTRTGIGNNGWSKVTYNGKTAYINSSYLTTTKPSEEPSTPPATVQSNSALQALVVTGYELTPTFNPDVKSYVLNVSEEVEQIEVVPTVADASSTYEITGNTGLVVGENIVNVIVTAQDGTKSTYEIKVIKGVQGLQLSSLILKGINNKGEEITINLDPTFSPLTKEYKANLAEFIKSITIQATANNENAQIEIVGADELKVGQNTIEIIVKLVSGEKEDIVNYTISLDNPAEAVAKNSININKKLVAIIAAISLNTIIGIVLAISLYRKQDTSDIYTRGDYDFLNGDTDFSETKVEDKTDFKEEKINPDRNNIIGDIFGDKGLDNDNKKGGRHF